MTVRLPRRIYAGREPLLDTPRADAMSVCPGKAITPHQSGQDYLRVRRGTDEAVKKLQNDLTEANELTGRW